MLRRLAGSPVRGENYFKADIIAGRIGAEQSAPHMKALDLEDVNARKEHDAYLRLALNHRRIAADLQETARQMAGYRDLPMGRHDEKVMADPQHRRVFEEFVSLESELAELLQMRLQHDRKMLIAMR